MRRISPLVSRGSDIDFDSAMTPMVDVVFLLLVFFVWTASFQIIEQMLPGTMSTQMGSDPIETDIEPPPKSDFTDVVIRIKWDGNSPVWEINGKAVESLAAVQSRLVTVFEIQNEALVILDPDPVVPLGVVIEAYDVSMVAGFDKISFAVDPGGQR